MSGENKIAEQVDAVRNLTMKFDRMGRRVEYIECDGAVTNKHQKFVYDDYLCIQRLNGANNSITELFEWDPTEPVATRPMFMQYRVPGQTYALFYTHDGNKNVSEVVHFSRANGVAAHYEYAPFGDVTAQVRRGGITAYDFAALNPWRFSSEYADDALACDYYNYRHYEPVTGRWLQRDPIEEDDFSNMYVLIHNSVVGDSDILGMFDDKFVCIKSHYVYKRVGRGGMKRRIRVEVCDQYVIVESEFPGHSKFSNNGTKCPFDYTLEDRSWWSRPENIITGTWRHFRDRDAVASDLDKAIRKCDAMNFQRLMHQYQDTFVHSAKGYHWPFGHIWDSLYGNNPDNDKKA